MKRLALASVSTVMLLLPGCGDEGDDSDSADASPTMASAPTDDTSGSPTGDPSTAGTQGPGPTSMTANTDPGDSSTGEETDDTSVGCQYPDGAVEPMALNEVLSPYSWPEAIDGLGNNVPLDLADAPCGIDDVIEWSPHDVLLFVSIPAW